MTGARSTARRWLSRLTGDTTRVRVGEASVPIALLPPGDYVARAIITVLAKAGK